MTVSTTQLDEASTISAKLGGSEDVQRLVKYLHTQKAAPHDLEFFTQDKNQINWAQFKSLRAWLLFKCDKGVAAIRRSGPHNSYTLVLSNDAWLTGPDNTDPDTGVVTTAIERAQKEIDQVVSSRVNISDNVIDTSIERKDEMLKAIRVAVGKIKEVYIAQETDKQQNKQQNRTTSTTTSKGTVTSIVRKFKPIVKKAITQADAELSGVLSIAIKAKGYERAGKIITRLKAINKALSQLENGVEDSSSTDLVEKAVRYAIGMTAVREYDINTARVGGWGEHVTVDVAADHFREILDRANGGDGKILSEVLYYFKRYMMLVK